MKYTIIKLVRTLFIIVLGIIVVLLAYFGLYGNITNEIHVRKVMDERVKENIQRLKDLREIQLEYKRQKGHYSNNADSLIQFLFNTKVTFVNTEKADEDSIPANVNKWNRIQNKMVRGIINRSKEAKRIYAEMGGGWKTLTEKEKIKKGYISVNHYTAYELAFTNEYQKTRNNSFKINVNTLENIKKSYNSQKSYDNYKSEYNSFSSSLIDKLDIKKIYTDIHSNFNAIFDLDTNTKISTKYLQSRISHNKKEIEILKSQISQTEDTKENAQNIIRAAKKQREEYTETISAEMVSKVREKAAIKSEKGKKLKGRKGVIWSILYKQDSTEESNKVIVSDCKNIISKYENEIESREKLIRNLEKDIQSIHDVNAMQNMYIDQNSNINKSFSELSFYTINEKIKIITTIKRGRYKLPTLPNKWKQAQLEADYLVEQSIDEKMLSKITEKYIQSGGKYRGLTTEEGYARGLIFTVTQSVEDIIFDNVYMRNRDPIPLNLDSITYIPKRNIQYNFDSKETHPNIIEQSQGEIDKYYFIISASYDDVFFGLDEEEKVLRKIGERDDIQVGSLDKTITNGNWGE